MQNSDPIKDETTEDEKGFQNQKRRVKMECRLKPEKDGCPSYTAMIAEAIMRTAFKRATLAEIYDFMSTSFEQLAKRGSGWRNCVRHTLSLNDCFLKLHRPENGRSCNWTIHPTYLEAFLKGDYRKQRKNRRKVKSVPWLEKESIQYSSTLPPYLNEQDMSLRHTDQSRLTSVSQWQNYGSLTAQPPKSTTLDTANVNSFMLENMYRDMKIENKSPSPEMTAIKEESPPLTETCTQNELASTQSLDSTAFPGISSASFKFPSDLKEDSSTLNRFASSQMTSLNPLKYNHHMPYQANGGMPYHHVAACQGYEVDLPYTSFAQRYKQEFY